MAKQTINLGSSANSGGGDPLRNALQKVNDNFDEVYTKLEALEDGEITTDIVGTLKGSVYADDSTLLVDGENGIITANVTGNITGDTTGYHTGDVTGSVFAEDSSLLVDAVNGTIPGYISITQLQTIAATSATYADFQAAIAAL